MSIFLTVIKIIFSVIGWTLLVLLFFPVRLDILWQDAAIRLELRYLFLHRRLVPADRNRDGKKDRKHRERKDGSASNAEIDSGNSDTSEAMEEDDRRDSSGKEKGSGQSIAESVERILRIVRPLMKPGFWLARMLLKAVRIRDMSVVISVTGSDPASIGFRSGLQWALIGNFMRLINSLFGKNVTYGEVTVYPCFGGAEPKKEKMSCAVTAQPIIIILLVLGFGFGFLFEAVRTLLDRGGKKNVN